MRNINELSEALFAPYLPPASMPGAVREGATGQKPHRCGPADAATHKIVRSALATLLNRKRAVR